MHRFWEIDEMVRLLVTNLPVTNFGKRKRFRRLRTSATAVALACCSKQLSAIVLDSLWEDVFDLNQLLKCFPPNSWEMRDGEFAFLRCPSTKEWDRFSSYARRIRTFSPCSIPTQVRRVSLEAYHLLSMQTPNLDHHLVPNLRSIHWRSDSWESIPFLRLFLNPELKNVRFDFPDDKAHPYRSAAVSLIPTRALTHL
ncbi:hypothetical protein BDM02DRAFT_276133 [Thelephora ganbajun]|uniref:Uncharacterized protein n=1 Tax=Thelephora ganbajun TaxID=370292 RepID=A0ACB6Z9Q6_THEGA|nr:hypothetical protein BDM02DRAFT_276133 [Thelephora ganbajun]